MVRFGMELDQNPKDNRGLIVQEHRNELHFPEFDNEYGSVFMHHHGMTEDDGSTNGLFLKPEEKRRLNKYFVTEDLYKYENITSREIKYKDKILYVLDVNRYAQNIFVLQHFGGSAGQFLSSCLTFADNVAKHLGKNRKIAIMKKIIAMGHEHDTWVDPINLSFDHYMMGVEKSINNNDPVFLLSHAGNRDCFFAKIRMVLSTQDIIEFFYNTRVIEVINWAPIYCCRHMDFSLNMEEFLCLDTSEKKKFINESMDYSRKHHTFFPKSDQRDYGRSPDYIWDANDFFRLETFLPAIQKMYDQLGLTGFDSELLTWYYNEWYSLVNTKKLYI